MNFEKKLKAKNMKKKYEKKLSLKNWKKLLIFFYISKTYESKEKFPSANRVSRCSQNNRQVIIGNEKTEKNEKLQKIKKNSSNFRHFFCHI